MSEGARAGGPLSYRHDQGQGGRPNRAESPPAVDRRRHLLDWLRIKRGWWLILAATMLVFSAFPIANLILGYATKDYGLWYQVGLAVRHGLDVYPRPETRRLFPFMYPPSAAAMLAWISMLGRTGSLLALVIVNSAAWLASILLSVWLAVKPGKGRHPLVVILPSLTIIVLVHNVYLLGQPNLLLLARFSAHLLVCSAAALSQPARSWQRPRQSRRFRSWSWAT